MRYTRTELLPLPLLSPLPLSLSLSPSLSLSLSHPLSICLSLSLCLSVSVSVSLSLSLSLYLSLSLPLSLSLSLFLSLPLSLPLPFLEILTCIARPQIFPNLFCWKLWLTEKGGVTCVAADTPDFHFRWRVPGKDPRISANDIKRVIDDSWDLTSDVIGHTVKCPRELRLHGQVQRRSMPGSLL